MKVWLSPRLAATPPYTKQCTSDVFPACQIADVGGASNLPTQSRAELQRRRRRWDKTSEVPAVHGASRWSKPVAGRCAIQGRWRRVSSRRFRDAAALPLPLAGEGWGRGASQVTDVAWRDFRHPPRSVERHSRSFASAFFSLRTAAKGGLCSPASGRGEGKTLSSSAWR